MKSKTKLLVDDVSKSPDDPIKLNSAYSGFYRIDYSPEMLRKFSGAMKRNRNAFPLLDRINLISDLSALMRIGRRTTIDYLQFIEVFKEETSFAVWQSIMVQIDELNILLSNTDFLVR